MNDVTKDEFEAYEEVRKSGEFNMFDANNASAAAGLSRDRYMAVLKNYTECAKKWPEVRQ